jgi:hypothetical protein
VYKIDSIILKIAINVPVLPIPALQWTIIGETFFGALISGLLSLA